MIERPGNPRQRRSNRKPAEKAAQSLIALLLLSTASGCATYDMDAQRPMAAKARPFNGKTTLYRVAPGDTINSIARDFGVSAEAIIDANRFNDPNFLRPGQRIHVPRTGVRSGQRTPRVQLAEAPKRPARSRDLDAPYTDPRLEGARFYAFEGPRLKPGDERAARVEEIAYEAPAEDLDAAYEPPKKGSKAKVSKHADNFIWPVRGKVIAGYGADKTGQHNDGINIAAEPGAPVKAAEGGVVIYAGNQLRSYGNLLLVRHPSGYVTAYAHNEKLLVSVSDEVKRGQKIALVGKSGSVEVPQLHFEIRRGDKPVNPADYLVTATASR